MAALCLLLLVLAPAMLQAQSGADGRYYIEFREHRSDSAGVIRQAGGRPVHEFPEHKVIAAWLSGRAIEGLRRNPNIAAIEEDPRREPMGDTTPYGISMVQADSAPINDAGAANRKICIIDSGYYINHEDLDKDTSVTGDSDSGGAGNWNEDGCGHGTHVAGTIAALSNGTGVRGVLPSGNVKLHIVKVFGNDCSWTYSSDLIAALKKCRAAGSNVVSMSLGGSFKSRFEENAFNDAYNAGVLSVAAAGNGGNTSYSYPASYSSVVSVAAVDSNKVVADFSQKNNQVELAAPGVSVLSTVPYKETNTLTVKTITDQGNWIEYAARTTGVTGLLVDGGLCDSAGSWSGMIVLCQRGTNSFYDKVSNVQTGGGRAAVIYNNVPGGFDGTLGTGSSSTIPAIGLSQEDGQFLLGNGSIGLQATVVSTSDKPASGYDYFSGTSMATPHVSGVAALVWSYNPAWTNVQIRDALQKSALDLGAPGRDNSYGYGLVQAKAALAYLGGGGGGGSTDTTPPAIAGVYFRKTDNRGTFEISWTTNEPSTSEVTFISSTNQTFTNATLVTNHKMTFKGVKGQTYTFTVSSTDAAGNKATSGQYTYSN